MSTPILEVRGVDAGYGDVEVLRDVDLEVHEGEIMSVVGANGAGKTTLMSTISGLVSPTSGEILFKGENIAGLPAHQLTERGLALVPEGRRLFPGLSVYENLVLGAYSRGARKERASRIDEVFDLFPRLAERRRQDAGSLSGGEQQMCAIARGVMSKPDLMMLDEPSLGLAPIMVEQLFSMVKALHGRGMTLLLVEQNVLDALEMSDRAYVLEGGRITLTGTGPELLGDKRVQSAYLGV